MGGAREHNQVPLRKCYHQMVLFKSERLLESANHLASFRSPLDKSNKPPDDPAPAAAAPVDAGGDS